MRPDGGMVVVKDGEETVVYPSFLYVGKEDTLVEEKCEMDGNRMGSITIEPVCTFQT